MLAVSLFLSLMGFWLLLSGDIFHGFNHPGIVKHPYLFWCGVVCCALVTWVSMRKRIIDPEGHPVGMLLRAWFYVPWLLWEILKANLDVAVRVWHPKRPIAPRVFAVPHKLKTDLGVVVYANSITLTPGTVTVDAGRDQLLVHALHEGAVDGLMTGTMHDMVEKLEVRSKVATRDVPKPDDGTAASRLTHAADRAAAEAAAKAKADDDKSGADDKPAEGN